MNSAITKRSTDLIPEELAKLKALADAATPGPYGYGDEDNPHLVTAGRDGWGRWHYICGDWDDHDTALHHALDPDTVRELVAGYEDRAEQRESVHKLASLLQDSHKRAQRYKAALRQMSGWYEDVEIARRALEEKP